MVVNPKYYSKPLFCGIEMLLGFLFQLGEDFIINNTTQKELYRRVISITGGNIRKGDLSKTFYRLKRNQYVEVKENSIILTDKAKIKMIDTIYKNTPDDNKNRFVSFDIPERLHARRDQFRRVIKNMGFRQIQQSLWVTNKKVGEMVELVAEYYKVSDYVAYIISEKSNIDRHIEITLNTNVSTIKNTK